MKRYLKELIILGLILVMFFLFPLTAGPTDAMGMVFIIIFSVFLLSFILGLISKNKLKFLFPVATAVLFLPSIPIYYNSSALVHSLWYLVISSIGLALGTGIKFLISLVK